MVPAEYLESGDIYQSDAKTAEGGWAFCQFS